MTDSSRRRVLGLLASGAAVCLTHAASSAPSATASRAVVDVLDLPARTVQRPERSVQLALARAGQRVVSVGERGVILLSDDAGRQWRQAKSVPVSVTLTAVAFADAQHGFAAGHSGVLLSTSDGGNTWQRQLEGKQAAQQLLEAIQAQPTGDDAAQAKRLAAAQRLVDDGPDKPWLSLQFITPDQGLLLGAYNLALTTRDGGKSWQPLSPQLDNPQSLHLYGVAHQAEQQLIVGEQGLLLASRDGGRHFERLAAPYRGSFFTAQPLAGGEWLVAGLRGNAWRSNASGREWTRVEGLPPVNITVSAHMGADGVLLINQAGQGFLSRDQGQHFEPVPLPPGPPVADALALPDGALITASFGGVRRIDLPTPPGTAPADPVQPNRAER